METEISFWGFPIGRGEQIAQMKYCSQTDIVGRGGIKNFSKLNFLTVVPAKNFTREIKLEVFFCGVKTEELYGVKKKIDSKTSRGGMKDIKF